MEDISPATKLTYDELWALFPDDDGVHRELIGGEIFVTPSPVKRHEQLRTRLAVSLGSHLDARPEQGELFMARFDVVLSPHDVVEPDLLAVLGDQQDILTEKNVRGAPGLVIEILSPSTRRRDQTMKRDLFDRQGVREYWIVDPDRDQVVIYRREVNGSFTQAATLDASETLTTPLLPGWSLSLTKLFA